MADARNIEAPESSSSTQLSLQEIVKISAWVIQNRYIFTTKMRYLAGFSRYLENFWLFI